jgi:hypothetical protein
MAAVLHALTPASYSGSCQILSGARSCSGYYFCTCTVGSTNQIKDWLQSRSTEAGLGYAMLQ